MKKTFILIEIKWVLKERITRKEAEAALIRAIYSLMKERAIESVINPGKDQYSGNANPEAGGIRKNSSQISPVLPSKPKYRENVL